MGILFLYAHLPISFNIIFIKKINDMPIIDKIQLSGTVYTIGSDVTVDQSLDSGSTNPVENRVIYNKIDEVEQVTAAGLNALNDNFGGLKLMKISQTDYDNLQVKDQNTLYIVI